MQWEFLNDSAQTAAPLLLGATIATTHEGVLTAGRIVEVEAYSQKDPASHTFNGETDRNKVMFGRAGLAYVYMSYGMHYCMNVVTGAIGSGQGVLLRAIEPLEGIEVMWRRRYGDKLPKEVTPKQLHNLTNGPGKLAKSLGISKGMGGSDLLHPSSVIRLQLPSHGEQLEIFNSRRIGLTKGIETPWRWYLQSPWVSRMPAASKRTERQQIPIQ